jgi:hypothetical protein
VSWRIPRETDYTLKEGDRGIVVWALQRQCNRFDVDCAEDGVFGPRTEAAVGRLQTKLGVASDGVAGPATQQALARSLCAAHAAGMPRDLLWSKCSYESGGYLGAVNWSVAGGVDCGVTQRRVYDEDYDDDAVIQRAFDAGYQVELSARTLINRHDAYLPRAGIGRSQELAWRTAVLYHNYQTLAERISANGVRGLTPYYTSTQTWVTTHGLRFPDGAPVRTPLEWGQRYSLGNAGHDEPGQAVKLVRSWA